MSSIRLSKVAYGLPHRDLFSDLNLSIGQVRQGLVGANGAGKSTLARIIAGELEPDAGRVEGSARAIYFRQMEDREAAHSDTRSGGEKRLARLRAIFEEVHRLESDGENVVLILDEPTNDLDRKGRDEVREFVRAREQGILIISHDRELLEEVDEIFELSSLGVRRYGGAFSEFSENVRHERENTAADIDRLERELKKTSRERNEKIDRQEKRQRQGKQDAAKGGIPKILLGARKRKAETTMAKIDTNENEREQKAALAAKRAAAGQRLDPFVRLDFKGDARAASQVLYMAENLQLKEGPKWPAPLTFQVRAQDRFWLKGANGSGKSSLLKILLGVGKEGMDDGKTRVAAFSGVSAPREFSGALQRAAILSQPGRLGFLDQNQSTLTPNETVLETIQKSTRFAPREIRNELAFYGFQGDSVHTKVADLSGGERLRLALAQIFLDVNLPAFLILDEPTNNLDFASLELLETAVSEFPGGILLVTHDEKFGSELEGFREWNL